MQVSLTGLTAFALQASTAAVSADAMPRMGAAESAAAAADDSTALQQMPAWQQRRQQPQRRLSGASMVQHEAQSQRPQAGSQGLYRPKRRHYGYGEKLAAAALWAAATGRGQSAQLRQCLTYSEIRLKALATAQVGSCAPGWSPGCAEATAPHSLTAIRKPDKRNPSAEPCCACRRSRLLHLARRQDSQEAQSAAHCSSGPAPQSPSWPLPWCPSPVQKTGCLCLPSMRPVHTREPEVGSTMFPSCLLHWLSGGERFACN